MANIDFPTSPSNGQLFTPATGITYRWLTSPGIWTVVNGPADTVIASDTPPASPVPNQLWFNAALAMLYVYYDDGNTQQWVPSMPVPAPNPSGAMMLYSEQVVVGTATNDVRVNIPANAKAIELWFSVSPNVLADESLNLQGLTGSTPISSSIYVMQVLNAAGSTATAVLIAAGTSWYIGIGNGAIGTARVQTDWLGNVLAISDFTNISAAGAVTARRQSLVANTTFAPTGFRLTFGSGNVFKPNSYFRCLAVL